MKHIRLKTGLVLVILSCGAQAQTRYVDATSGDDTSNDCSGQSAPCSTIAHALDVADSGDVIDIAEGLYIESFTIDKDITLKGAGQDFLGGTIIAAHEITGQAESRVVTIGERLEVSMSDLQISRGVAQGPSPDNYGGGIYVARRSHLALGTVTVASNEASQGGGIYLDEASGTFTNVMFSLNTAQGPGGGLRTNFSAIELNSVEFVENQGGGGGGMSSWNNSPVLTNVRFFNNQADYNGGGFNYQTYSTDGEAVLTGVNFVENAANSGGGFYTNGNVTIQEAEFTGNTVTTTNTGYGGTGGGMHSEGRTGNANILRLTNSTFSDNEAEKNGGGIYMTRSCECAVINVVLKGNKAGEDGGGMHINSGSPVLTNVTLSGNDAFDYGGGLYNTSSDVPTLTNTIVWGNTADLGGAQIYNGDDASLQLDYNLYGDEDDDIVEGGGFMAASSVTADPLFADAASGNLRLSIASPAIDTGNPATDPLRFPLDGDNTPLDHDGNPRFDGATIDIGAYEVVNTLFQDRFE